MNNFLIPSSEQVNDLDPFVVPIEKNNDYEEMEEVSLDDLVKAFSGIRSSAHHHYDDGDNNNNIEQIN